jgi:hypothetical protein
MHSADFEPLTYVPDVVPRVSADTQDSRVCGDAVVDYLNMNSLTGASLFRDTFTDTTKWNLLSTTNTSSCSAVSVSTKTPGYGNAYQPDSHFFYNNYAASVDAGFIMYASIYTGSNTEVIEMGVDDESGLPSTWTRDCSTTNGEKYCPSEWALARFVQGSTSDLVELSVDGEVDSVKATFPSAKTQHFLRMTVESNAACLKGGGTSGGTSGGGSGSSGGGGAVVEK